jgi:putative hemolysin
MIYQVQFLHELKIRGILETVMKQRGRVKHLPKSRFASIAILLFIVLLIIGFFGRKNNLFKVQVSPTPAATPGLMAGWLTYTNLKYYFSFKFPSSFGGQGSISGPATGTVTALRSFTDPKTIHMGTDAHFDGFSVYIVTKLGTVNFDKYVDKEIAAMNAAKFTGMRNPTKVQLSNGVVLVSKDGGQAYYYLPKFDQSEIVVFAYLQADDSFKQTFEQVLSTFEFTDAASSKVRDCITKTSCQGLVPCMANPASVFCVCMGGEEKIIENSIGQSGICKIGGKEQDEWKYFRSFTSTQ